MEGGETLAMNKPSKLKLRLAMDPPSRKLSRLLQRLKRAVGALRSRQVDKQAAEQAKLKQANLEALDRLRCIAKENAAQVSASERREGSAKCPSCGREGARLLVALNPGVVLECLGCGEVWKEEGKHA